LKLFSDSEVFTFVLALLLALELIFVLALLLVVRLVSSNSLSYFRLVFIFVVAGTPFDAGKLLLAILFFFLGELDAPE